MRPLLLLATSTLASIAALFPAPATAAWDVIYKPPVLSSPLTLNFPADFPLVSWPPSGGSCGGQQYRRTFTNSQDVLIKFKNATPVKYPVHIIGGRNVRLIGMDINIEQQSGCGGDTPTVPGGAGLYMQQAETTFVEGLRLDLNGHYADCIISRNNEITEAQALANRKSVIQNSACRGARGTWAGGPNPDFLHSDLWQNQGSPNDPMNQVIFENISQRTTATGVVTDGKINEVIAHNFQFGPDTRYTAANHPLNPLWMEASKIDFKNVWTAFDPGGPTGNMPISVRNEMGNIYYTYPGGPGGMTTSNEIHHGAPPNDFAPWDQIGVSYVSPHDAAVADGAPPSIPSGLSTTAICSSKIDLAWTASTDNIAVTGYKIFRNGVQVGTSATTGFSNTGLTASTTYTFAVSAYDAANNESARSSSFSATTLAGTAPIDGIAPSVPTGLSGNAISGSQINLIWTASTDNVGATGYKIFRNAVQAGISPTPSFTATGLTASTTYSFTVSAYDAASNDSAQSPPVSIATQGTTLPDMAVLSLTYDQVTHQFTSVIKNQGTAATPADKNIGVSYWVDGVNRTWGAVLAPPGLAAGASATVSSSSGAGPYTIPDGTHSIMAVADDIDRFSESDETNNSLTTSITVGATAPCP